MHIKQRLSLVLKGPKKEPSLYNLRIINCQMSCPVGLQLPLTRCQWFLFFPFRLNHVSLRISRPTPSPWACLEKYAALNCQSITLLFLTHLKRNSNIFLCHASQLRFLLDSLKSSSLHAASVFFTDGCTRYICEYIAWGFLQRYFCTIMVTLVVL